MSEVAYSIVVPSRHGGPRLLAVLEALDRQEGAPPFEVVVVDDGSDPPVAEALAGRTWSFPLELRRQAPRGPAAARNVGVAVARAPRVAFLGDDTEPLPDWLAEHERGWRRRGAERQVAVLGYTDWHPRLPRSRFLTFLNEEGLQFGFSLIDQPENVPFNFFYTSNVSLDRELAAGERFDEGFPYPAWEDVEAAYRLVGRGMRLVFHRPARVAHDHPTDFARFCERQEKAGYCAVRFARLHPELGGFLGVGPGGPPALPSPAMQPLREALVRALQFLPVAPRKLWTEALRFHYVRGLHRAWRESETRGGE